MNISQPSAFKDVIKAFGVVFGDIGTSPLYTISSIFAFIPASLSDVMGVVSLIIWTLILLVTVQYAWLAMSLNSHGEGGSIVLKEILMPYLKSKKTKLFFTILSFLGVSFFIGDGTITPAISILSAVEGFKLIPHLEGLTQTSVILMALVISLILFLFQRKGTEAVSLAFGPIMLVWFIFLSITGFIFVIKYPEILKAFSPYYGIKFLFSHGFIGFLLLSKVILCATGAEALYADMGHVGRKPIIRAWIFVFISLCLIYMAQGVFLLQNPGTENIFYEMILYQFKPLYIPLLILSICATVIASQAMISGLFSIVYQGITTHILPRLHVEYTSQRLMSQIYIPTVNWFLMVCVFLTILKFQNSTNLTNAYGLAVSSSMTISAILLTAVLFFQKNFFKAFIALLLIFVNCAFLFTNFYKIPYGGYWSLITACVPLTFIVIYTLGQKKLYSSLKQKPLEDFVEKFSIFFDKVPHINGTAIFLSKTTDPIPTYIARTIFNNNIIYEENIIVQVETLRTPFGVTAEFADKELAAGLKVFEIKVGYLEILNIEKILNAADIHPKVIFYGVEEIKTRNPFWHIYTIIKKLTPSFVEFYKLSTNKLHGVIVRVEI